MVDSMVMVTIFMLHREEYIKVIGNKVKNRVLENWLLKINMAILETGMRTKNRGEDVIFIPMGRGMKAIG